LYFWSIRGARKVIRNVAFFYARFLETIDQRLIGGYIAARKNGIKVGRKKGIQIKSDEQFLKENKDVAKLLKQGYAVRKIMKLENKSSGTMQKVKKR
jgi:DNA invertase Pin-like site-specific DNA recombinase